MRRLQLAALLAVLVVPLWKAGPAAADPIGPDCATCQGSIYELLYDPTPVGSTGTGTIYEITLRIDTTGYTGGGARIDDVSFKVSPSLNDVSLLDAPGGAVNWSELLGGINAGGCQANTNNGFACTTSNDDGVATLPFVGVYEWVFNAEIPTGDSPNTDPGGASIKARYVDGDGDKVGDLVSEPITLQVIPEPGTVLLLGAGLIGLGARRRA